MTPDLGTTCAERVEAEYFDQDDGTCWQCGGGGWVPCCGPVTGNVVAIAWPTLATEMPCDICGGTGRAP